MYIWHSNSLQNEECHTAKTGPHFLIHGQILFKLAIKKAIGVRKNGLTKKKNLDMFS